MWKLIQTLYYMKIGIGILLLFFVTSLQAQNIIGKVIDNKKQPVDGATIVLQAIDSTYINASISNVDGTFVLDSQPEEYRLIVQHLLYRTKEIEGKGRDVGVIQLDPQDYALDEVVVKAERPFVKVEERTDHIPNALLPPSQKDAPLLPRPHPKHNPADQVE